MQYSNRPTTFAILIALSILTFNQSRAFASDPTYCPNGTVPDRQKFWSAMSTKAITIAPNIDQANGVAYVTINNSLNCELALSLSSYEIYDSQLVHQVMHSTTPELSSASIVPANGSKQISVKLPPCISQVDLTINGADDDLSAPTHEAVWATIIGSSGPDTYDSATNTVDVHPGTLNFCRCNCCS